MNNIKKNKGSILILSLWLLLLLAYFLLNIGLKIRLRAKLLSRIEGRMQLQSIAAAGIKKSISIIKKCRKLSDEPYSSYVKSSLHNSIEEFKDIKLGSGTFNVFYEHFNGGRNNTGKFYGVVDEESKINLNVIEKDILNRLMLSVITSEEDEALALTEAIIDWRTFGDSQIKGFYSDDYYSQLKYSYDPRNSEFENIDELLLVAGIDQSVLDRLMPFVTIYGDGAININTSTETVLLSLGLSKSLVEKILYVRCGPDVIDATNDDYIFLKPFDIAIEMKKFLDVSYEEAREIDFLNSKGLLKTNSSIYMMKSVGTSTQRKDKLTIVSVFDFAENDIIYYREK